jgi:hypothetical protein
VPLRRAGCGSSTMMLLPEPLWLRSWSHIYFTASLARSKSHLSDEYIAQALRAVRSLSETRKHRLAIGCAPLPKSLFLHGLIPTMLAAWSLTGLLLAMWYPCWVLLHTAVLIDRALQPLLLPVKLYNLVHY